MVKCDGKVISEQAHTAAGETRSSCIKRWLGADEDFKLEAATGRLVVSKARFEAIMRTAEQSGLLSEKSSRIGGRVSPALVWQAKRQTGIETDTDLIEFALATVALEDNFAEAFKESRGKVAPTLKLDL
jgi:hypothetical protein